MAVLDGQIYLTIATNIATARDSILSAVDDFYSNVYEIVMLNDIQQTLDLLEPLYSAYTVSDTSLRTITLYQTAISSLNNHILTRGGYSNINQYLTAEEVEVPQTFADLSSLAGFPIDESHIQ
jgi:hypothetical protein